MKIEYQIQGSAELLAKLKALGGDVDKAVESGLMQGAKAVQKVAKQLCPVDTGQLRNSIAVTTSDNFEYEYARRMNAEELLQEKAKGSRKRTKKVKGHLTGGNAKTAVIGTSTEYAACVEFGTGSKGDPAVSHTSKEKWVYRDDNGKFHTSRGQKPQPFLTPALRLSENTVRKRFETAIKKAIRERSTGK